MITLPLTNNAEETFTVNIFGELYNMRQLRNTLGFWTLDIIGADGTPLVYGVKIVTKTSLLSQYPQVPFDLIGRSTNDPGRYDFENFILEVVDKDV